ncbi:sodium:solute symporter family protein [Gimibacter soli]|uniref:Na+:solute symporter n=1 Tax=Gimibacter soli TaxID=3024400 RepID=A0AAE9XPX0_9PROT|nr:sodium:solute symporter family protein [Gimibacter soli]WCL54079.1 Na+:solute symporter [Gimibacter soli]
MHLTALDWAIVALVLFGNLAVGLYVTKRASASSASFFLGGRHMPWWLLGTSMVATTFAADTPNLVTGLVRTGGVAANWAWWCFLLTGMLTAFVYAKLWRRLGVTTDNEFYERRYSGKPAAFLRGFRAVYLGIFFNVLIMGNVTLAAIKYGAVLFNVSPVMVVVIAGGVTVAFSAAGGLLGVLVTDMVLFVIAMAGAIIAALYALDHPSVGGLDALLAHANVADKLPMVPDMSDPAVYVPLLVIPLAVQWWASWYPGSEPGGGGYVAQRMLAAKNERHAVAATVFFNLAHYALRPWPWIIVALASLVVFPDIASLKAALPQVPENILTDDLAYPAMLTFLPAGLLGLVMASIVAAYVSTISTSLNWGASYVVNDVYVRFMKPDATDKQQVMAGRVVTVLLMVLAGLFALTLESANQGFNLLLSVGAGTGLLFILRWFWSRINAWSEVAAMVISFAVSILLDRIDFGLASHEKFVAAVAITTAGWVIVTLLTPKTDAAKLSAFKAETAAFTEPGVVGSGVRAAAWGVAGVYALLFGLGQLLYGNLTAAALLLFVFTLATARVLGAIKRVPVTEEPSAP